jgi:gas vesicle protein GvpO
MSAKEAAQERRARGREERRRSATDRPSGAADDIPVDGESAPAGDPGEAIRTAASAALVGAAVGAAKALTRRRAEAGEGGEPEPEAGPEAEAHQEKAHSGKGAELEPEMDRREPEFEAQAPPDIGEAEPEHGQRPRRTASPGEAQEAVRRAKDELRELRGGEPDSVSAVTRTDEGWRVGLEVVEVQRVPESTDVLATYEVELTDEGALVSFGRTRRYYRSEADRQ